MQYSMKCLWEVGCCVVCKLAVHCLMLWRMPNSVCTIYVYVCNIEMTLCSLCCVCNAAPPDVVCWEAGNNANTNSSTYYVCRAHVCDCYAYSVIAL